MSAEIIAKHDRMTKITLVIEIAMTLAVSILIGYVAKNILHTKMKEREYVLAKCSFKASKHQQNKYL